MKEIPLTQGKSTLIDDEDFESVSKFKWKFFLYAEKNPSPRCHHKYLHRFIMDAQKGQVIDHINGNKLDNRKGNLRFCTQSGNTSNSGPRCTNKTGVKGVSVYKGKFRASITKNYKQKMIGTFATIDMAAAAYAREAEILHGEFRRTA